MTDDHAPTIDEIAELTADLLHTLEGITVSTELAHEVVTEWLEDTADDDLRMSL